MTDGTVDEQSVDEADGQSVERADHRSRERAGTVGSGGAREWIAIYLKGAAMGAADTVPGVSGGTIALITGIYERLITALTGLDPRLVGELRGVHRRAGRRRLARTVREVDLAFLVVLGLGVVTAIVTLSRVVHAALVGYRAATYAFFFGLIAASAVVLYRELRVEGIPAVASGVVGFALAFAVAGASSTGWLSHDLPVVFATGALALTAMVLPGVSGAFILLLLGQYEHLTGVLTRFVDDALSAATGGGTAGLADGAVVVATFGVGAVVGVLGVAHAVRWALDRHRRATFAFLVSLMVGSLRLPVLEILEDVGAWTPTTAAVVGGAAGAGALAVLALDRYTDDLDLSAAG